MRAEQQAESQKLSCADGLIKAPTYLATRLGGRSDALGGTAPGVVVDTGDLRDVKVHPNRHRQDHEHAHQRDQPRGDVEKHGREVVHERRKPRGSG